MGGGFSYVFLQIDIHFHQAEFVLMDPDIP